jgi:exodeoxyribonuclease V beta subunit
LTDGDAARALGPADIAVLCRTRWQVDLVRKELNRRRVPSVAARAGGVFAAPAAEEWRRFLFAVEHPERSDYVRLAATTLLVGNTVTEVAAFTDEAVLDLQEKVRQWHELLVAEGVPPLVAAVDRETGLSARVLGQPDGERTMTDLTHIAEEMHAVWRRGRMGSLRAWLEAAIAEARRRAAGNVEETEERQRRLETDAAAVTVQTIHAAKGLQWPVVLVPFTWDRWVHTPKVPVFHDPTHVAGTGPRRRLIDVGGNEAPDFADHVALAMAEDEAEESRLLYVALTRAEHHLVVWWLEDAPQASKNALTGLVTAGGREPALLPVASEGTIELAVLREPPPVDVYVAAGEEPVALSLARLTRPLDHEWRRVSFSSLSPEHPLTSSSDADDELMRTDEAEVADDEPAAPALALPMADLPRGARFGTLVHEILEGTAFDDPVLELALGAAIETARTGTPADLDAVSLVAALVTAIHTPLGPEPDAVRLRDLAGSRLLKELSFELPVRTGSESMTLRDIGAVMLDHLPAGDRFRAYAAHLESLAPNRFRGYLTGSIDLTAALPRPSGRHFVVMDFKSNALPTVGATARPEDYGPGPMATAMIEGDYVLQATLYLVALHRYLQWRLPDYDPSVHLGGSRYLFVRGMAGADAPVVEGERCGVSRWEPPPEMIVALSHLFRGMRP